jgi:Flp pilus assembly protein TadG
MRFFECLSKSRMAQVGKQWSGEAKPAAWLQGLRHLSNKLRAEEGQSLVEFALTCLLFLFLVFAIFDFGHLFFVEMDVQNAIQEAARYGSTGNHLPDPKNPGQNLSRVTSIIDTLQNNAIGVQIPTSNITVSSTNLAGVTTSGSGGAPRDLLTVTATVNMPLITPFIAQMFPNGQYTFKASITIMNEQFPASQTQ